MYAKIKLVPFQKQTMNMCVIIFVTHKSGQTLVIYFLFFIRPVITLVDICTITGGNAIVTKCMQNILGS